MKVQERYFLRFILSFFVATVLFSLIFLSAYSVSYLNYQNIQSKNKLIQESLTRLDQIIESQSCDDEILFESSETLDRVGSQLNLLENRFGKDDFRVLEQKKIYSDLEYKHLQIIKNFNGNCNKSFQPIIFFYSNLGEKQDESENMGSILTTFKRRNPEIMVYSFDFNLEYETVDKLKNFYKVTDSPIIVIGEKQTVYIRNIDQLEEMTLL